MPINNHLKCKWAKPPTKRHRLAERMKKQDSYVCCLQEAHLRPRDTYRLKVGTWRKWRSKESGSSSACMR